ncbi:MAG: hypothetical protein V8T31_08320 [Lachnospiraceae bacterium]
MLDAGNTPEQILENLLGDLGVIPVQWRQDFTVIVLRNGFSRAITSIGKKRITEHD